MEPKTTIIPEPPPLRLKKVCLLYLDILGYDNFLKRHGDEEASDIINRAFYHTNLYAQSFNKATPEFSINYKGYSDNLIFYIELDDNDEDFRKCFQLVFLASFLQDLFIVTTNTQLRGAITIGDCYIGDYVFGKAYMEAHHLESKVADWGRIMVSDDVVRMLGLPMNDSYSPLIKDESGTYIDFLTIVLHPNYDENRDENIVTIACQFDNIYRQFLDQLQRVKTVSEMIEVSKILHKNNKMLDYISTYCKNNGYGNLRNYVFCEDDLFLKWKQFQGAMSSKTGDVDLIPNAFDELIQTIRRYKDSLDEFKSKNGLE